MFPLYDDNPTFRTPIVTIGLIATMLFVWIFVQGAGNDVTVAASVCNWGLVPAELTHLREVGFGVPIGDGLSCVIDNQAINWLTPILSLFLHGELGCTS